MIDSFACLFQSWLRQEKKRREKKWKNAKRTRKITKQINDGNRVDKKRRLDFYLCIIYEL